MASDLQGDYPFHSTLSQEVAAKSRMPKGVGQDRRFGQTKRGGLRGYFVCQTITEMKIK